MAEKWNEMKCNKYSAYKSNWWAAQSTFVSINMQLYHRLIDVIILMRRLCYILMVVNL